MHTKKRLIKKVKKKKKNSRQLFITEFMSQTEASQS
jgi:hypothetical protein